MGLKPVNKTKHLGVFMINAFKKKPPVAGVWSLWQGCGLWPAAVEGRCQDVRGDR